MKKQRSHNENFRASLRRVIFGTTTPAGRRFDIILLWLIILSIITVILESVKTISNTYHAYLVIAEWFFTIIFTLEYCLRIYASDKKMKYILSYMGLIDLIAIIPTYLTLVFVGAQYFLVLRGLRLLRMFRILKMIHYLKEIRILMESVKNSLPKISIFMLFIIILVTILGSAMYVVEGSENGFVDIPNSIYWAIVTLATVGYGDITPVTPIGKMLASVIILIGYGIIAVPTGIITSEIIKEGKKSQYNQELKKPKPSSITNPKCPHCHYIQPDVNAVYCSRCGEKI